MRNLVGTVRWMCYAALLAAVCPLLATSCERTSGAPDTAALDAARGETDKQEGAKGMGLEITSTAFENGGSIPKKYTGDGPDVSPPLAWDAPPDGTQSFALICDDPDAPVGTWVHWVIYDIGDETRALPEGVPAKETLDNGAKQGVNDFRKVGYGGPAPPRGKPHRYFFKLYAVDTELELGPRATKKDVLRAIEGHVLAQGELMGTYQR